MGGPGYDEEQARPRPTMSGKAWGAETNGAVTVEVGVPSSDFFSPHRDPYIDYNPVHRPDGNKPLAVLIEELVVMVEGLVPCNQVIPGSDGFDKWHCPDCGNDYWTSPGVRAYCGCCLGEKGDLAVRAVREIKRFLDGPAKELLDSAYALDKPTCQAHNTDSQSVKATRTKLFKEAADRFHEDRTTIKVGE